MSALEDLFLCLRFFSRLPLPAAQRPPGGAEVGLASAAAMVPLAGAAIAVFPCLALLICAAIGLSTVLTGALAIAVLVAVTGALHEDGLCDCADGFGGGVTPERKLEIMRDSRIGTYGACALALSLYLRATALGIVTARAPMLACAVLVASASVSRTVSLMPLVLLQPARRDGLGALSGRPSSTRFALAIGLAILIAGTTVFAGATIGNVTSALAVAGISGLIVTALAWRQIRGQTGDVAGAAQQIAEIAVLLTFSAS